MRLLSASSAQEWTRACAEAFVPLETHVDEDFRGRIDHLRMGDIGVSLAQCTASRAMRTERTIRSEPRDDLLLNLHLGGSGRAEGHDGLIPLQRGAAIFFEADRRYGFHFRTPIRILTIRAPRRLLPASPQSLDDAHGGVIPGSAELVVLTHFLVGLLRAGRTPPDLSERYADTASDLLTTALQPLFGARHLPAVRTADSLYLRICHDLERRAADPRLSLDDVARRHDVSRRQVELVFADHEDSPAAYLRRVRLLRARRLLCAGTGASVSDIAQQVGFFEVGTFIRAFRREWGMTPGAWRSAQVQQSGAGPAS